MYNGSIDDMYVQIIDHCDPIDKENLEYTGILV